MLGAILLVPSFFCSDNERRLRDSLLLATVFLLNRNGISSPRTIFVASASFVLIAEIINDVTYRILPPSLSKRRDWLDLQKRQIKRELTKLLELRHGHKDL